MALDDVVHLEQHVLLDRVVLVPRTGPGEGIDEEVERRRGERIEIHHQEFVGVDPGMRLEHLPHLVDDRLHPAHVVVAHPDRLVDPAVEHPGQVLDRDGREDRVGDVEGAVLEGADAGEAPSDPLDGPHDLAVGRPDDLADREGPVEIDHERAEEVRQHVAGREPDRDPADPAEGQHSGDAEPEGLHHDEGRGDDDRRPEQLGEGVEGGSVRPRLSRRPAREEVLLHPPDEAHQEPRDAGHHPHVAGRIDRLEDRPLAGGGRETRRERDADHPDEDPERAAEGVRQGVVPRRGRAFETPAPGEEDPSRRVARHQGEEHGGERLPHPRLDRNR